MQFMEIVIVVTSVNWFFWSLRNFSFVKSKHHRDSTVCKMFSCKLRTLSSCIWRPKIYQKQPLLNSCMIQNMFECWANGETKENWCCSVHKVDMVSFVCATKFGHSQILHFPWSMGPVLAVLLWLLNVWVRNAGSCQFWKTKKNEQI